MRRIASRRPIAAAVGIALWLSGGGAVARDRLYSLGADRLLIEVDGHVHRFRPVPPQPPWQGTIARFRTVGGHFGLFGADGRYRLSDTSGDIRELHLAPPRYEADTRSARADCSPDCVARTPPPADFDRMPSPIGAARLDLRPASCRSYFTDFAPIERGIRIEHAMAEQSRFSTYEVTVRSFPSVDLIGEDEMIVLRSLDLATPSFSTDNGPDALHDEILADVARFDRSVLSPLRDGVTLEVADGADRTRLGAGLEPVYTLIVRHGMLDEHHAVQIGRARLTIARRFGVRLDIIEIP